MNTNMSMIVGKKIRKMQERNRAKIPIVYGEKEKAQRKVNYDRKKEETEERKRTEMLTEKEGEKEEESTSKGQYSTQRLGNNGV
jgi:hypothetical protein